MEASQARQILGGNANISSALPGPRRRNRDRICNGSSPFGEVSLHVSEYNSVAGNGEQFRADENNCLGKRVRNRVLNKARLQKVSRALDLMENTPSPT